MEIRSKVADSGDTQVVHFIAHKFIIGLAGSVDRSLNVAFFSPTFPEIKHVHVW